MNELRHDEQVQSTIATPPHLSEQPRHEQLPKAGRTRPNVNLTSLSVLFALFVEQRQLYDTVIEPDHIHITW